MRDAHHFMGLRDQSRDTRSTADRIIAGFEVAIGAGAVGYAAGLMGSPDVYGVPLGLAAGLAGHALTLFDFLPVSWEPHVHELSNGAIAGWMAVWALGQGATQRQTANRGANVAAGNPNADRPAEVVRRLHAAPSQMGGASPMLPPRARAPLNEAELQAIMMRRAA